MRDNLTGRLAVLIDAATLLGPGLVPSQRLCPHISIGLCDQCRADLEEMS